MMPPNNQSVTQISRESGIHVSNLNSWRKQFQTNEFVVPAKLSSPDQWGAKSKLAAIIQTTSTNESERSSYCHEHGIYPEQLNAWKIAFEAANATEGSVTKAVLAAERKKSSGYLKQILKESSKNHKSMRRPS